MGSNNIAISILKKIISFIVFVVILILIIRGSSWAYSFGHAIFYDESMSSDEDARDITITISEGDSALDVGKMLERRGLIEDAYVFFVQSYCYEAGRKLAPGEYDLTTDMDAKEIMNAIVSQSGTASEDNGET